MIKKALLGSRAAAWSSSILPVLITGASGYWAWGPINEARKKIKENLGLNPEPKAGILKNIADSYSYLFNEDSGKASAVGAAIAAAPVLTALLIKKKNKRIPEEDRPWYERHPVLATLGAASTGALIGHLGSLK